MRIFELLLEVIRNITKSYENKTRIARKRDTNPSIKVERPRRKTLPLLIIFALFIGLSLIGCSADHPLLRPDSIKVALDAAADYVSGDCKSVGIYPGYELDFGDGIRESKHGFGGFIGGCGEFVQISCQVVDGDEGGKVECKQILKLKTVDE